MRVTPFVLVLLFTGPALAQSTEETAVRGTINKLFDGMIKADSAMLKPVFTPNARLQTVVNKQGTISISDSPISSFISRVGMAKPGLLDERLASMDIKIDGELATAWTPYVFYRQGQKDHCGVNAFTLVKLDGTWQIQGIIDTRRAENCPDLPKR
ncbi:nuclear transport factor 2 family protein [Spirosoma rhododendri]|uniref:Nuclear transport factor 2 family protein n=1 Tax=Spirosoma rhododendri TaxID=2728024 RepID=A0A7L5DST9_9BACT|nr:nuclear transport factor 2 family protein [Spirosoma rhododendri]QJD78620.1 nuclear transport factor 2 family protein [Spirosoma rhododendri]